MLGAGFDAAGAALKLAGTGQTAHALTLLLIECPTKQLIPQSLFSVRLFTTPYYMYTGSNFFWLFMFGQSLASFSNVFIWTAAPLLSEVWFPPREKATATAIGGAIAPQVSQMFTH